VAKGHGGLDPLISVCAAKGIAQTKVPRIIAKFR
jgi:hypothetical protein